MMRTDYRTREAVKGIIIETLNSPLIWGEIPDKHTRLKMTDMTNGALKHVVGLAQYRVVCDETNNTPAMFDDCELQLDIYADILWENGLVAFKGNNKTTVPGMTSVTMHNV